MSQWLRSPEVIKCTVIVRSEQKMTQIEVPVIYSEQAAAGCACRAQFLRWVETMMQNNDPLAGLSVKDLLLESGRWCGPADHLAAMMSEVLGRYAL